MQGKRLVVRFMTGLAASLAMSSVFAVMSIPYGWYIEANAGSTTLTKKSYPGSASSSGVGGNVNIGYKFIPYLAAEAGYSQYANTSINAPSGTKAATDKHYSYDLALRGILPIYKSGVELFAKLGGVHISSNVNINNNLAASQIGITSSNHNDVNFYLGAGVSYYFMPEFAAVAEWQRANGTSGTGTIDLFSGGLLLLVD